ncbi:hypothetical protein OG265_37135 (plasmid) [Streptomyces sp. NBC_01208]|nr:hypothetical protein OG265_36980 [Streptomyces sp. NBC_01208]WSR11671.1 hypothetical protein OG265_37135 [Streptomyces sp. NBC_01208]
MFRRGRNRQDPQAPGRREVEGPPVEGVPDYMEIPLRQWVMVLLQNDEVNAQRIALHLKLRVDTGRVYSPAKFLAASTTKEQLLDVVSTMLAFSVPPKIPPVSNGRGGRLYLGSHVNPKRENAVDALQDMLTLAGSSYRVNEARTGLELRIDETAQKALSSTVAAARTAQSGSAAEHLSTAWKCAYGRDPDPSKAYSEAIKAVESASQAVIEPSNAKATLGSMLGVIRNSPQRFSTAIPAPGQENDIELVSAMMQRLWKGQTARHGSQNPTRFETQREAEMAVHLAATLVQWLAAGLVQRTP